MALQLKANLKLVILGVFILSLGACSPIFNALYGIKNIKPMSDAKIITQAKEYKIPLEKVYQLDTSYTHYLKSFDSTAHAQTVKNHYQPLQIIYFDATNQMVSYYANCYAGGFPNLNWNRFDGFSSFPPKTLAPLDTLFSVNKLLSYQLKVGSTQDSTQQSNYDYLVLVYWNRFLGRQSKRMIKLVQDNLKLSQSNKIKVVYINNDNFFLNQTY